MTDHSRPTRDDGSPDAERRFDTELARCFAALRDADVRDRPDGIAMLSVARAAAASALPAPRSTLDAATPASRRSRRLRLAFAAPLLAAAALALILLQRERVAEREFDALVTAWSESSAAGFRAPTDALLQPPGSEFLTGTPSVDAGAVPARSRRPS
jgi:hypothetical protein